jgi:hypothetical protein
MTWATIYLPTNHLEHLVFQIFQSSRVEAAVAFLWTTHNREAWLDFTYAYTGRIYDLIWRLWFFFFFPCESETLISPLNIQRSNELFVTLNSVHVEVGASEAAARPHSGGIADAAWATYRNDPLRITPTADQATPLQQIQCNPWWAHRFCFVLNIVGTAFWRTAYMWYYHLCECIKLFWYRLYRKSVDAVATVNVQYASFKRLTITSIHEYSSEQRTTFIYSIISLSTMSCSLFFLFQMIATMILYTAADLVMQPHVHWVGDFPLSQQKVRNTLGTQFDWKFLLGRSHR